MVSQVRSQEATQERLRKAKFIILPGPRNRRHSMPCGVTWGSSRTVRRQEGPKPRENLDHSFSWSFLGKGKTGQDKQLRLAGLNNFVRLWAPGVASGCLYLALG